ncbi:hypothetical protein SAMN04488540_102137 [Ferrimonas sediminum]|uniref:Uncharacterized protein n=1 Tax=Ferrimonas sediminum TaxID=718193 RepID=A0A1G8LQB8_9GAMM|nr:hypothetical protein SAMN04488540_102137 [Ferrimonas sediminum]
MNYSFAYNVSLHGSWSNMSWNATAIYFAR